MDNYESNDYDKQNKNYSPNGLAMASLILGIISIPAGCCYGAGIIFGIIGLVLGLVSRKRGENLSGLAIGGIVCSSIGILIGVAFWALAIIGLSQFDSLNELEQFIQQYNQ